MILSALICFPSLYIFFGLTGVEVSLKGLTGVLLAMLALTGLLLLGFAPVAWVLSQSTLSVAFIGTMYLAIWSIATALRISSDQPCGPLPRTTPHGVHIGVWKFIFLLVALQMTTALRPIVGVSPHWLPSEKKFFLSYWSETLFKERTVPEACELAFIPTTPVASPTHDVGLFFGQFRDIDDPAAALSPAWPGEMAGFAIKFLRDDARGGERGGQRAHQRAARKLRKFNF